MIRILLVSEDNNEINRFKNIFTKGSYDFETMSDETLICDLISVEAPDIIIIDTKFPQTKDLNKKIKSICENTIIIFALSTPSVEKDLIKFANAFITKEMTDDLILSTINVNLRMKNSLEMLSSSNKDLADSLYRLNALYTTSSQFAGTLDKSKLINYMIEGMDKALSFSLTCTLSLCTDETPVSYTHLNVEKVKFFFEKAAINYLIPDDIIHSLWLKYMLNVAANQTTAILRMNFGEMLENDKCMDFAINIMKEVQAIAKAEGVKNSETMIDETIKHLHTMIPEGKTSMLQDVEAGRKTEVAMFAGTIIKMGKELGIPTPYNKVIKDMIEIIHRQQDINKSKQLINC